MKILFGQLNYSVGVVYQIPCQCGRVCWGNAEAPRDASQRASGCMQQGGHVEVCHSRAPWDQQHQVDWDVTRVLDRAARPVQLKVKEALYIEKTPANNRLNRDGGYELPGCWIAMMKKLEGQLR